MVSITNVFLPTFLVTTLLDDCIFVCRYISVWIRKNVPAEFDLSLIDLDSILSINLIDKFLKACIVLNGLKKSFLCRESIELHTN